MSGSAYYDRIARKWHAVTGAQGGALKRFILNDLVLDHLSGIAGLAILELGAGNGYFLPLVLRRFSGQVPERIVITDQSRVLLDLGRRSFRIPEAEYRVLDVRHPLPFAAASLDLIVANMLFNELPRPVLKATLAECRRVLVPGGRLLATITHPVFIEGLARRGLLKRQPGGFVTMPGADGLRLPVVPRGADEYDTALAQTGFRFQAVDVASTPEILKAKPALRQAGDVPIARLYDCQAPLPSIVADSARFLAPGDASVPLS